MRGSTLLSLSLALGSLACVPHPGGECSTDLECGYGTTCQRGLCRSPPPAPPLNVTWLSPERDAWRAAGPVAIALVANSDEVTISTNGSSVTSPISLVRDADGVFRGSLDTSGLADGLWTLSPHAGGRAGGARAIHLDRSGPRVAMHLPVSPAGAFLRSQSIRVYATVIDDGVGVDPVSLALVADGVAPIPGTRVGRNEWGFAVRLADPTLFALEGPVALRVVARDLLGNESHVAGEVPVTRVRWRRQIGDRLPIRSSPALDEAHLYVGTDAGQVVALDRRTGVTLWSHHMTGPVSGSPALGALVYAGSEGGDVAALDPATGEAHWTCADPAWRLLASPAIAQTSSGETLFLSNASAIQQGNSTVQGGVLAVAQSFGNGTCSVLGAVGGGQSSVAVGNDGTLYVGGLDQRAHALRFDAMTFREIWSSPMGDDITGSPALSGAAVFADVSGHLAWFGSNGAQVKAASLGQKLLASPIVAFSTALVQGRDGALGPFIGPPIPYSEIAEPVYVAQTLPGAGWIGATPAAGADGVLYVPAGHSLRAIAPGGAVLWEAPLSGGATASSPTIGCDGTLYVGDASGTMTALVTDSAGLAPGWPRFRHDAHNSGNAASQLCE